MTTAAARKGAKFEADIRDYLRGHGIPAERIPAGMSADRGDLSGITDWTVQLKNYADMQRAIRDGLAGLELQQAAADTPYGAVIVKRRGTTDPGRQLVVMELWQAIPFMQARR